MQNVWDQLVTASCSPFLFYRAYMDYHEDRFADYSALVYEGNVLVAALPCTISNDGLLVSHAGLTYGGLIKINGMKSNKIIEILNFLFTEYKKIGIRKVIYKVVPDFYNNFGSQSEGYALFVKGASFHSRGLSAGINLKLGEFPVKKIRDCKNIVNGRMTMQSTDSFEELFREINKNLMGKYATKAVHSSDEMALLKSRFPNNIQLYELRDFEYGLCASAIVYEVCNVAHIQYMVLTETGMKYRSLDKLVHEIYGLYKSKGFDWLEFGVSTTDNAKNLNVSLARKKEEYGATPLCYDAYYLDLL